MREEKYTQGFNAGYQTGYDASRKEIDELKLKIEDLQSSIELKDTHNESLNRTIKGLYDEVEQLRNIVKESTELTLTVGFTEMQVKAYQPVTGLFFTYEPENISGDATEFRADQKLFFDICHRDLGKCKIKGHYNGEGIFIITNIEVLKEK